MSTTATTAPAKAALPNEGRPGYKHTKLGWIPEEWDVSRVGDVCQVVNNLRAPLNIEERAGMVGSYPYYGPTGVLGYINEYRIDGTYCLIGEDGDHFLDYTTKPQTLLVSGKFNVNNHAHLVQGTDVCDTEWFFRFFHHRNILPHITRQGAARYKLNKAALEELLIAYPQNLPEQRRIAAVLGAWDRAIATAQELLAAQQERKRGLMQELLTGKRRFPGFRGKWKAVPFDKVFTPKKEVAGEGDYQVLSVTTNGLVSQADYFSRDVASTDRSNYLVVRKGDFVFSGLNFWMGSVDMVWDFDEGIISPAYKCFTINEDQMLPDFARHFIRSHVMLMALVKCSIQGASIVRRNLDKELLEAWPFKLPSLPEQRKIADALNAMTDTIQALEQELDHLTTQKRGLMQQLLTGTVRVKH